MFSIIVGTGYTGLRVLHQLSAAESVGLSRSAVDSTHRVELCDLDAGDALPVDLPDDYVLLYTVPPSPPRDEDSAYRDRRAARLLEQLSPLPSRVVYISTTGVYGNRDGAIVTEATQPRPETERARRRVVTEQMFTRWGNEHDVSVAILRSPGIYGPDRLGVERLRDGAAILREEDANPGNRIHVDDLVRCCIAALDPAAPGGVYNVSDGDQRSTTWFTKEVARQCGLDSPPEVSRRQAIREFSKTRMSFLAESRRIDSTRMREVLGVTPAYDDAEEGIRASL
jgi:nucleoside-diphosphate-sugar epimerase